MDIQAIWDSWEHRTDFSGVFSVRDENGLRFLRAQGLRNRGEGLAVEGDTAFAIASGTKLFTGLAACKLIESGRLALEDRLWEVVGRDLGQISREVTVGQLLTHTSGVGDYIDEEQPDVMDRLLDLYRRYPVYTLEQLSDYLPMITPLPQKFSPGQRYSYSNSGFILLGLVIEAAGGRPYRQYVTQEILEPMGMAQSGFFRADALPGNVSPGFVQDAGTGLWRSNIFSMPALGGSDGGLYTTEGDLDRLWRGLLAGRLLSPAMAEALLSPQVDRGNGRSYGLGVYRWDTPAGPVHYAVGGDFGVDFFTACLPGSGLTVTALGNTEVNTGPLLRAVVEALSV